MLLLLFSVFGILSELISADVNEKLRQGLIPSNSNYPGLEAPYEESNAHFTAESKPVEQCNSNNPLTIFLCKSAQSKRNDFNKTFQLKAIVPSESIRSESFQKVQSDLLSTFIPSDFGKFNRNYLPPVSKTEAKIDSRIVDSIGEILPAEPAKQVEQKVPPPRLPNVYLPIEEPNVSPDSTNILPNIEKLTNIASESSQTKKENQQTKTTTSNEEGHSLERLCNDPFHSFLCTPTKGRKKIDGKIRAGAKIPASVLQTLGSSIRETHLPLSSDVEQTKISNEPLSRGYLPVSHDPIPKLDIRRPTEYDYFKPVFQEINFSSPKPPIVITTAKPSTSESYISEEFHQPIQEIPGSTNQVSSIQTAFYSSPKPFSQGSSNSGYIYPKPTYQQVITYQPTSIKPTYQPSLQTTTYKPSQAQTTYRPPTSPQTGGYYYTRPSTSQLPSTTLKPLPTTTLKPFTTYRPSTTTRPSSSYDYNSQNVIISVSTQKPQAGYVYSQPTSHHGVSVQSTIRPSSPQTFSSTTSRPTAVFQQNVPQSTNNHLLIEYTTTQRPYTTFQPSTGRPDISTGYVYSKPSQIFTLPTTLKPNFPQEQNGFSFQKPEFPTLFNNDVDTRPVPSSEYYFPQSTTVTTQKPQPSSPFGYHYSKPSGNNIFTKPSTYKPYYTQPTRPSNQNVIYSSDSSNGYQYTSPNNFLSTVQITTPTPSTIQTSKPVQTFSVPQNSFGLTTTHKPYPQSEQLGINFYQRPANSFKYPQSDTSFFRPTFTDSSQFNYIPVQLVEQSQSAFSNGYTYSKPSTIGSYTTSITTTTQKPTQTFQTTKPTTIQQTQYYYPTNNQETIFNNGYHYAKPGKPFPLPPRPPTPGTTYPTPTSTKPYPSYSTPGYSYSRPANPFQLPRRERPSSSAPESTTPSPKLPNSIPEIEDLQPLRNFEILKP